MRFRHPDHRHRVARLKGERKKLSKRLAKLDADISKLERSADARKSASPEEVDKWMDELARGLPELPLLPTDFSRADLYNDHD